MIIGLSEDYSVLRPLSQRLLVLPYRRPAVVHGICKTWFSRLSLICDPDRWHRSVLVLGCAALNIGSLGVTAVVTQVTTTAVPLNAADPKMSSYCRRKRQHYYQHNVTSYLRASLGVYSWLCLCFYLPYGVPGTPPPAMACMVCMLIACTRCLGSCGCVLGTLWSGGWDCFRPCRIIA